MTFSRHRFSSHHLVPSSYPISTVILSGTPVDKCSNEAAKDLLQVNRVSFEGERPFRTLLQRDPSFARAHAHPALRMTFHSIVWYDVFIASFFLSPFGTFILSY